jgi:SAM-dependent methyltransferase
MRTEYKNSGFTAHNIRLDNGELTIPSSRFEFSEQPVLRSAKRVLKTMYPSGFNGKRIVDLGCLEGGYAVEFARMGFDSVGIEVRQSNFENCMYVKNNVDLPKLEFAKDDVWNIQKYGHFDVIFCCGLLYHLDRPMEFVKMASEVCADAIIINTHYASTKGNHAQPHDHFTEHEGTRGLWYGEYRPDQVSTLDEIKWASWSNRQSFWPEKEYFPRMLKNAGFDLVFEQFDWLDGDMTSSMIDGYYSKDSRTMFVGIKTKS